MSKRRGLVAAVVLASVFVLGAQPASAATCSDYANQADAQRAADTRDGDGDGIYCEALPCPCLKPRGGGGDRGPSRPPPRTRPRATSFGARITAVVDGDTIKVRTSDRRSYTVRLIGIDTPETKRPGTAIECGGREATSSMLRLAFSAPTDADGDGLLDRAGGQGRRVRLNTDPTQDRTDRYRRLLAYARTGGADLGAAQLSAGWAKVYVFERPFRELGRFRAAEAGARSAGRGVWGACGGDFDRAAAALAASSAAGVIGSWTCSPFSVGPATFRSITAVGVPCSTARRLLDRTTLSRVRRGRRAWTYAGFRWRFRPLSESSARVSGSSGRRRITAIFGQR